MKVAETFEIPLKTADFNTTMLHTRLDAESKKVEQLEVKHDPVFDSTLASFVGGVRKDARAAFRGKAQPNCNPGGRSGIFESQTKEDCEE